MFAEEAPVVVRGGLDDKGWTEALGGVYFGGEEIRII